jgi:hypothetical protein
MTVRCLSGGFSGVGVSDSFEGVVVVVAVGAVGVGGLSGFGERRPDCACPIRQQLKTTATQSEPHRYILFFFFTSSRSPYSITFEAITVW